MSLPATARRDSAILQRKALLQVVSAARIQHGRPGQLFTSTQIPVCLWFLAKNKTTDTKRSFRRHRPITAPAHSVS